MGGKYRIQGIRYPDPHSGSGHEVGSRAVRGLGDRDGRQIARRLLGERMDGMRDGRRQVRRVVDADRRRIVGSEGAGRGKAAGSVSPVGRQREADRIRTRRYVVYPDGEGGESVAACRYEGGDGYRPVQFDGLCEARTAGDIDVSGVRHRIVVDINDLEGHRDGAERAFGNRRRGRTDRDVVGFRRIVRRGVDPVRDISVRALCPVPVCRIGDKYKRCIDYRIAPSSAVFAYAKPPCAILLI